ncbi:MAG: broad specificity phosphatase PhoE [Pseudomonadales bacterium]|jgi:broad specificity phosphatase PhoE
MAIVYLVRHGEAAASWGESNDPGLSVLGKTQAINVANELSQLAQAVIISSPKLRAVETAQPLAKLWHVDITIEPRVTEIPTPIDIGDRSVWLKNIMKQDWQDMDDAMLAWQKHIIAALSELTQPTIVFCHFMVINAVAGWVSKQAPVLQQMPNYGSINQVTIEAGELVNFAAGKQLTTIVN